MTYRPGELDQRVSVQRETLISDGLGGDILSWVNQGYYWCHVRPMSARESVDFDQRHAQAEYLFVFRNGISILDTDRIDWEGEQFNIVARKQPKGRALYVEVIGARGVAQ